MSFDHILVIGFGGPGRPEDVQPFLEEVTRGRGIPAERLREVSSHYEAIGGISPYCEHVSRLVDKLNGQLLKKAMTIAVFTGMKNWHPFLKDTLAEIRKNGFKKGIGIILAPQRSDASFDKYVRAVEEAKQALEAPLMEYEYVRNWHDHPLFIEAQADRIREALAPLSGPEREALHFVFTAHSVPVEMAGAAGYGREFENTSMLVAQELGIKNWSLAFQSRSGSPRQPWLEPDVVSVIRGLSQRGIRAVMLVPVGFINDNVEVLYDLDVEARKAAAEAGIRCLRASTVMDHPKFVKMFAELIEEITAKQIC